MITKVHSIAISDSSDEEKLARNQGEVDNHWTKSDKLLILEALDHDQNVNTLFQVLGGRHDRIDIERKYEEYSNKRKKHSTRPWSARELELVKKFNTNHSELKLHLYNRSYSDILSKMQDEAKYAMIHAAYRKLPASSVQNYFPSKTPEQLQLMYGRLAEQVKNAKPYFSRKDLELVHEISGIPKAHHILAALLPHVSLDAIKAKLYPRRWSKSELAELQNAAKTNKQLDDVIKMFPYRESDIVTKKYKKMMHELSQNKKKTGYETKQTHRVKGEHSVRKLTPIEHAIFQRSQLGKELDIMKMRLEHEFENKSLWSESDVSYINQIIEDLVKSYSQKANMSSKNVLQKMLRVLQGFDDD